MHLQFIFVCFRLSIKWLKRAEQNKQTFLPPLQREVGATRCTRRDCEKIAWTSSPSRFWRFSSFARGAVPSYSSRSQNTKFISLYQSLTVFYKIYTRATPSLIAASATAFATVSLILSSNA